MIPFKCTKITWTIRSNNWTITWMNFLTRTRKIQIGRITSKMSTLTMITTARKSSIMAMKGRAKMKMITDRIAMRGALICQVDIHIPWKAKSRKTKSWLTHSSTSRRRRTSTGPTRTMQLNSRTQVTLTSMKMIIRTTMMTTTIHEWNLWIWTDDVNKIYLFNF